MNEDRVPGVFRPRLLPAALAAWLGYLALDFLMHAVFLAGWWRAAEPYLLPPRDMLRLIPLGYASFAIYCGALTWLLARLYGERLCVSSGLRFGVVAGVVSGVASALGTYSVFRMPPTALLVWPASVAVESAIAGGVSAWVLAAGRPWRRVGLVFCAVVVLFIAGVVIQNLWFPTPADHMFS
ncbi:MAG: hypothetical protein A3H96_07775 [Acidobacteria bacterium RIFCSPLOWO2_02_FULL_67_36]|nr:MAG: hypothetical protein A3H96_07775 [Acidobacteria bacterium RIFCSPLOWO2_02_FULL_67_36]OFW20121.1 MAG: hypothetical protein A3G21_03740 [Acidobacteria bacterium RIFCSPLOWO2_12_FULL_66_21]